MKKNKTEIFINKAKNVHGDKYDYSLVEYVDSRLDVIILFNGVKYYQKPQNHLNGKCPEKNSHLKNDDLCRLQTEEFIKKAKEVHGDKYDYSQVIYKGVKKNVNIIHNGVVYKMQPYNHLKGCKCENIKKLTHDEFIKKAREVHGEDYYDYSLTKFTNVRAEITFSKNDIIYTQKAYSHLAGKKPDKLPVRDTNEIYIQKAKMVHGDKYDYSLVDMSNKKTKYIEIIYDGKIYKQHYFDHLRGNEPRGVELKSRGVKYINDFLTSNNIVYETEKKFNDCVYKKQLPFDFYIPIYNLLIEFDGEQHFKPIKYYDGEDGFIKRQIRDNIKTNFGHNNSYGLRLLRISYLELSEIENILRRELNL